MDNKVSRFFYYTLLLLILPSTLLAQVESFQLRDIKLEGLQRVSSASVYSVIKLRQGDLVNQYAITEAIRDIFETGLFKDVVAATLDNHDLIFTLYERASISNLELEGNKALKSEDLLKSLSENGVTEGNIYNPVVIRGIESALEREYVSQGHYTAAVDVELEYLPRNRVKVKILVDEGKKTLIRRIQIIGNKSFSNSQLVETFELQRAGKFAAFSKRNKYSRTKLEGDIEKLESFYLDKGYLNFKIDSTQVSISPDKRSIFITIHITEGEVYQIGDIELLGDLKIPEERLRNVVFIDKGDRFSQAKLTLIETWINQLHANFGYTFSEVEIRKRQKEIEDNGNTESAAVVDIDFFIKPGSRTYVRRIEFRGNIKTTDDVLRREMRQFEAAPASNGKIDIGKVRLERLVNFETVEMEQVPVPGTDDQIDVIYSVKEQNSGSVSGSIGYSDLYGLIIQADLSERNFLGTGKSVGLNLTKNNYSDVFSINYSNPFFTLNGINSGISLSARQVDYSKINISTYSTNSIGLNFNLGYPIGETQRLSMNLGVEQADIKVGAFAPEEVRYLTDDNVIFNSLSSSIYWQQVALNRGLLPTGGYQQSLSLFATLPISDLNYYRINYSGQIFVPVKNAWVIRFKNDIGFGDAYGNRTDKLPFFQNFYGGGFGSVRGFEGNTLGPRETPAVVESTTVVRDENNNIIVNENGTELNFPSYTYNAAYSARPIGGNVRFTGSVELILGFAFLRNNRALQSSLFFDYGNIFDTQCGNYPERTLANGATVPVRIQEYCYRPSIAELRYSSGISFSWISALGPMSFSFGETLNKSTRSFNGEYNIVPEESKFFQFRIGGVF